ncbi:MAG: hypothetical protein ACOYCB_01455 [Fastidiosipilaceae bacterium]|nr:hypothetical protein [Clostridiaceae bacterium]
MNRELIIKNMITFIEEEERVLKEAKFFNNETRKKSEIVKKISNKLDEEFNRENSKN